MTSEQQQQQLQQNMVLESVAAAMIGSTNLQGSADVLVEETLPPPSVNTAGLNSLSEAAVKGMDHDDSITNGAATNNSVVPVTSGTTQEGHPIPSGTDETESSTTAANSNSIGRKLDLILTKLDDLSSRLERVESLAIGGSLAAKSAARLSKPRNKTPLTMKTAQGNPIQEINLHFYDNEYHVLPESWVLPRLSFEGLMHFWYLGDPSAGVPPLIKVGGTEFKNLPRGVRKRSDMKYLMKHVERKGKELGCYIENINDWTADAVRNLFARTKEFFEYPNKSSAQTKFDKLSWETVCHNLRRNKGILVGEDPHEPEVDTIETHITNNLRRNKGVLVGEDPREPEVDTIEGDITMVKGEQASEVSPTQENNVPVPGEGESRVSEDNDITMAESTHATSTAAKHEEEEGGKHEVVTV